MSLRKRLQELEEARDWMTQEECDTTHVEIIMNIAKPRATREGTENVGPSEQSMMLDREILLDRRPEFAVEVSIHTNGTFTGVLCLFRMSYPKTATSGVMPWWRGGPLCAGASLAAGRP